MIHLRVVAPPARAGAVLDVLRSSRAVVAIDHRPGGASQPDGDLIVCDVAREDASVVLACLRDLGIERDGHVTLTAHEAVLGQAADRAIRDAPGSPVDAVVWEQVAGQTSESAELSGVFLTFMVLAGLIAAVGIYIDLSILVVGAMVVGPEFGPVAGVCVALVQRRGDLAWRSARALLVGFPLAVAAVALASLAFRATGVTPDDFTARDSGLADTIANPDFLAGFVALAAGVAGMLSLSTAKSGALIGVLISVTTIPAAAEAGISAAYGDGEDLAGAAIQLGINVAALLLAGTLTLAVQRALFDRRRAAHDRDAARRRDLLGVE